MMDPGELRAAVERLGWFRTIDLGHGVVTPGRDESSRKLGWIAALVAMLREEGFERVDVVHREPRAYRYAREALRRLRAQQGRLALHARRLS